MPEDLGSFSPESPGKLQCKACDTWTETCDGDRCDSCGNWTCYGCGTHVVSGVNTNEWLCPGCAEVAELADEMEVEE